MLTKVGELFVEERGTGPVIVCWPSLFCDGRTLSPQVEALSKNHRLLIIDGPGHGKSGPPPGRFTLEDCAGAVMQILDEAAAKRAVFLGVAWGGHVGVAAALLAPQRLRGLVLMNAPMSSWSGLQRVQFWTLLQLYRALGPSQFLVRAITQAQLTPEVRAAHPEHVELIADCVRSSERRGMALAIQSAMLDRPSLVESLSKVKVPTLFLTGDSDKLYPVEVARAHAQAIPGARFHVIAGSAHQSGLERPSDVNALVADFIAALPAGDF